MLGVAGMARAAGPVAVLFVGDSYTFGRVAPVLGYNAARVHDLTAAFAAADPAGSHPYEPHPWGGIAGVFKKLTDEAGLDYDVSISARNATSLRSQLLDAGRAGWDLRGNIASRSWDVVVLQEQSDAALPFGRGRHADLPRFTAYAGLLEQFIHDGAPRSFTEARLYGGLAACRATGESARGCGAVRSLPANAHASAATRVYLTATWARPDMVFAHRITRPDAATPDGRPVVDTSSAGGEAPRYQNSLAAMSAELHRGFAEALRADPRLAGVVPAGDAFQRAVDVGIARSSGFYDGDGVHVAATPGEPPDLWWQDGLHASARGSYLDALVHFGAITGLDPRSLGAGEEAAADLGIDAAEAVALQRVAAFALRRWPRGRSRSEGSASAKPRAPAKPRVGRCRVGV